MYGNWQRVRNGDIDIKGVAMIDPSEMESAAMKQCLKFFGEAAGEIGFTKPLGDYSEAQEQLPRAYLDPTHFECKFCSYAERCWSNPV